jgi:hypothetical protein
VPRPVSFFHKRNIFRGTRLAKASQINNLCANQRSSNGKDFLVGALVVWCSVALFVGCARTIVPFEYVDLIEVPKSEIHNDLTFDSRPRARISPFSDTRNNTSGSFMAGDIPSRVEAQGSIGMVARSTLQKLFVEQGGDLEFIGAPSVSGDIHDWSVNIEGNWFSVTMTAQSSVTLLTTSSDGKPLYRGTYQSAESTWSIWPTRQKVRRLLANTMRSTLMQAIEDDNFLRSLSESPEVRRRRGTREG